MPKNTRTLEEKTYVEFPRHISLRQTEEMLRYISETLPAIVTYTKIEYVQLSRISTKHTKTGSSKLTGRITLPDMPNASDSFRLIDSMKDFKMIGIEGGYNPNSGKYQKGLARLWNNVRKTIDQYFEHH